jgi:NDP-sugar pyrophosphorylase family protein
MNKSKTTIVLMAGGESSRFQSVPGSENFNKNSFKLPNGDSMIEMCIRMYKNAGFTNFTALLFHKSDTITDLLKDGSPLGVNIQYSYDPEMPVGKGGAILNALQNGSIPKDHSIIVHNPDDVILNFEGAFPDHIAQKHNEGLPKGTLATVVVVEETPYAYTGMNLEKGFVKQIEMYPMVKIPTHIGVTILDPKIFGYFTKLFDLTKKSDFEQVLFPILASEQKLYSASIPNKNWLAVNALKAYKLLLKNI